MKASVALQQYIRIILHNIMFWGTLYGTYNIFPLEEYFINIFPGKRKTVA